MIHRATNWNDRNLTVGRIKEIASRHIRKEIRESNPGRRPCYWIRLAHQCSPESRLACSCQHVAFQILGTISTFSRSGKSRRTRTGKASDQCCPGSSDRKGNPAKSAGIRIPRPMPGDLGPNPSEFGSRIAAPKPCKVLAALQLQSSRLLGPKDADKILKFFRSTTERIDGTTQQLSIVTGCCACTGLIFV